MAKKYNALSFPIQVSSEVERLFDETIQRPCGFGSAMRVIETIAQGLFHIFSVRQSMRGWSC